jgi:hypothetical protein
VSCKDLPTTCTSSNKKPGRSLHSQHQPMAACSQPHFRSPPKTTGPVFTMPTKKHGAYRRHLARFEVSTCRCQNHASHLQHTCMCACSSGTHLTDKTTHRFFAARQSREGKMLERNDCAAASQSTSISEKKTRRLDCFPPPPASAARRGGDVCCLACMQLESLPACPRAKQSKQEHVLPQSSYLDIHITRFK